MAIFQEIPRSPDVVRTAKSHYEGVKRFVVTNANAVAMENTLWNSYLAGYGGPFGPRCRHVTRHTNYPDPGLSTLIAHYETMRQPGVALLRGGRAIIRYEPVTYDLDDQFVSGIDVNGYKWKPIGQTGKKLVTIIPLTVETCYASKVPIGNLIDRAGCVNSASMPKLGIGKGVGLLMDFPFSRRWKEDDLWYVDIVFLCKHDGWNETAEAQRMMRVSTMTPGYDELSVDATLDRPGFAWVCGEIKNGKLVRRYPESRRVYPEASFADIDRMIVNP